MLGPCEKHLAVGPIGLTVEAQTILLIDVINVIRKKIVNVCKLKVNVYKA